MSHDELKPVLDSLQELAEHIDTISVIEQRGQTHSRVLWQTALDEMLLKAEAILRKHGRDITLEYPQRVLDTRKAGV